MTRNRRFQYLLALAHFGSDINQTALATLIPFIIATYHFDYTTAAMLVLASNTIGAVIQPVFGHLADKYNTPWVICLGLLFAGGGIAAIGFADNFTDICVAVMASGIGVAMFHPQGARLVRRFSDDGDRATAVSIFSFGGSFGFAVGPAITAASIAYFGIKGTLALLVPEILICLLFAFHYRELSSGESESTRTATLKAAAADRLPDQWTSFGHLCIVIFGRSIILHGLNTFLILYWIHVLNQSESLGSITLSAYHLVGTIATLAGGKLSDKHGYRFVMKYSFALLVPALVLLPFASHVAIATLLLIPVGAAIQSVYSPVVVLGQQYLPNRIGLAAGVTLGLAVSVGGIFAPVLGRIADAYGLSAVMYAMAALSFIPGFAAFTLPKPVLGNRGSES